MPKKPHIDIHEFKLTSVTTDAVTFRFKPTGKNANRDPWGWVIATVNDATGELNIQSDWGNYAYRWHIDHLGGTGGVPSELGTFVKQLRAKTFDPIYRKWTLTEFIGNMADCNYLANKLDHAGAYAFSGEATTQELRRMLVEKRVEAARSAIEYYSDCDPGERPNVLEDTYELLKFYPTCTFYDRDLAREVTWSYDKNIVRRLYDELGGLDDSNCDRYLEGFFRIEGYQLITEEPYHSTATAPTGWHQQLEHGILPAIVRACADRVNGARALAKAA